MTQEKSRAQQLVGDIAPKLAELATHLASYAGWPAGMSAATTLKQVLDAR